MALGPEFGGEDVELTIERSVNVDDLPTMRVVHFFSPADSVKARMYAGTDVDGAEALFGIHYNPCPVWAEQFYANHDEDQAIDDFNAMEKAASGALVTAYYGARAENLDEPDRYDLDDYLIIGICPPGSAVRAIPYDDADGNVDFVKCLPLINTAEVSRDDYEELFADNIPGHSIYETTVKESRIREAYSEQMG